jgi:hypothetical protein
MIDPANFRINVIIATGGAVSSHNFEDCPPMRCANYEVGSTARASHRREPMKVETENSESLDKLDHLGDAIDKNGSHCAIYCDWYTQIS